MYIVKVRAGTNDVDAFSEWPWINSDFQFQSILYSYATPPDFTRDMLCLLSTSLRLRFSQLSRHTTTWRNELIVMYESLWRSVINSISFVTVGQKISFY